MKDKFKKSILDSIKQGKCIAKYEIDENSFVSCIIAFSIKRRDLECDTLCYGCDENTKRIWKDTLRELLESGEIVDIINSLPEPFDILVYEEFRTQDYLYDYAVLGRVFRPEDYYR